jgi:hypothetical protein
MTKAHGKGHQIDFDCEVCVICGMTKNQIDDTGKACGELKLLGKIPGEKASPRADRVPRRKG